ncbi:HD domain-containing protein [Allohahella marinimesophila]|uniref:HD domain-containing protein n=1 Tax=Allohahella marinimesophila TaxID=1054972 RepID=A0ABP7PTM5_9GAMM
MTNLDKAIAIATRAHAGQTDKGGNPYILHVLRVMMQFEDHDEMIVAVLHDVVEDTGLSAADLEKYGFSEEIIASVDCLSRQRGESYDSFLNRIAQDDLARRVKIADIKDNLNLTRLDQLSNRDIARARKYHKALKVLAE